MTLYLEMNPRQARLKNDIEGLSLLGGFGYLRAKEIGLFLWPKNRTSKKQAERLLRSWRARNFVIERELPGGEGRLFVLSQAGVEFLADQGVAARSGKHLGSFEPVKEGSKETKWVPPISWRHDLIAARLLADLTQKGWETVPDWYIRKTEPGREKYPDGIAIKGDEVLWLEVESAKKEGSDLQDLVEALADATTGKMEILGRKTTGAMVAFRANARDTRSHKLDHRLRVENGIAKRAPCPVEVQWASIEGDADGSAGVISYSTGRIVPALTETVKATLEKGRWTHDEATGGRIFQYENWRVWLGYDEHIEGWAVTFNDEDGAGFDSEADALHGAAEILAGKVNAREAAKRKADEKERARRRKLAKKV